MTETRSVVVEREIGFPPAKVWRALTQPHFIEEWLMKNDFAAEVGRPFALRAQPHGDWNGVIDCKVLEMEPEKRLSYTWNSGNGAQRIASIVTWTLTPSSAGTLLRMEQSGFRAEQVRNFEGARYGWRNFFGKLEELLARTDG
ncbi:MAG: SRPBCC domain-containing protein [Sphingobium sp.]|nr:SRPBCC domain-containing protein [Sphingobium sp.]